MEEQLLTPREVAKRLMVSTRTLNRNRAKLLAHGLQIVRIGKTVKYRKSSLDEAIRSLALEEQC